MRRLKSTLSGALLLLMLMVGTAPGAELPAWLGPADWELDLDVRLVDTDGRRTFVDNGLGTLRYGQGQSGLRLGRVRFAVTQPLGEQFAVHVDTSAWGDHDRNPIDVTEAYLLYRPYPFDGFRFRLKTGAFYAPISLENRASGWESPYTLSYSALNTWIGQELRTIGVEGQLDWLGSRLGHGFDVGLTGGVFGWNDPAGVVLANRGFALGDRQTSLFGRVGTYGAAPLAPMQLFQEIDNRPGWYAGIEGRYLDRVVVRALHYDNRGKPDALDNVSRNYAWNTKFDAVGARLETPEGWTGIVQWLKGEAYIEPEDSYLYWLFNARYALVSRQFGKHRLSVRYDSFEVQSRFTGGFGDQHGHAWTAAYVFELPRWRFTLEWLRVWSDAQNRVIELGEPAFARETQLQLAVRYALRPGG